MYARQGQICHFSGLFVPYVVYRVYVMSISFCHSTNGRTYAHYALYMFLLRIAVLLLLMFLEGKLYKKKSKGTMSDEDGNKPMHARYGSFRSIGWLPVSNIRNLPCPNSDTFIRLLVQLDHGTSNKFSLQNRNYIA